VIGKTEGNGGVNDFTRILADQAFRRVLLKHGTRSEAEIHNVPMVWSGGCDGVITPHATIFARNSKTGAADKSRLVIGTALSAELLPEDIGRPAMVLKVADAVKAAMKDAGITDPKDVHYVQTKTPLLTIDSVRDARNAPPDAGLRGPRLHGRFQRHHPRSASPWHWGKCRCPRPNRSAGISTCIRRSPPVSSGVELTQAQIVLLGNKAGAGGRYRIGHSVMHDALDIDGIYDSIRDAGIELPERPRSEDLKGRVVNCFMKCEADRRGVLRGRRQIMLDDFRRPPSPAFEGGGRRGGRACDRRPRGIRIGRLPCIRDRMAAVR